MSHTLSDLEIERLSVPQKLELIGLLWESIPDSEESLPLPEWHRHELDQRLRDADSHPDAGTPWEQVKARLKEDR